MSESRVDALTLFFVVSAVILGGMWWLEQHGIDELEQATIDASEFSRDHLGPSCEAFAVGQGGATLVVRCLDEADAKLAPALAQEHAQSFADSIIIEPGGAAVLCRGRKADACAPAPIAATEPSEAGRR